MTERRPKLMNFSRMREILAPHDSLVRDHLFMNADLAVLRGSSSVLPLIVRQKPPFVIDDHRLGIVTGGEACINMNLVEKHLAKGMLVYVGPGSILNPVRLSPQFEVYGFVLSPRFPMPFASGQMPTAFNGQVRDFQLPVDETALSIARGIVELLWQVVRQPDYDRQTVSSLVAAQMSHYDSLYRQQASSREGRLSREQTIFDRFIYLVNRYVQREHQLAFYAAKMCLSERYLGTVVRQASGTTAKQWIDRALLMHMQVELRHTDKSVARIADELCFANASFFSKYFRRATGMSPLAYRRGKG